MQHDSKRWFTTQPAQSTNTPAAPVVLDDELLSQIAGGITEPPEPINLVTEAPNGSW